MKTKILAAFLLCLSAVAEATSLPPILRIVRLSSLTQTAPANTIVATPFRIQVVNEAGFPVQGMRIIFGTQALDCGYPTPPPTTWPNLRPFLVEKCAGGYFPDWRLASPETDADGIATVPGLQVNDQPGTFAVYAVLWGGPYSVTEENIFRVMVTAPARVRDKSGYAFVETAGEYWWEVEVTDGVTPVVGVPIEFSASGADGASATLRETRVNTDSRGRPHVTYTTGDSGGILSLTARMGGDVATTSLEVFKRLTGNPIPPSPPPPALSPVAGTVTMKGASSVFVGARLLDAIGLPVAGERIHFSVEATEALVVSPAAVITDRDGFAYTNAVGGTAGATYVVSAQWADQKVSTQVIRAATAPEVQDLWWAGELESGWGVSIVQHGETLFSVLYIYDDTAHTTWLVMPGGSWNEDRTIYTGKLYRPRGTPFWIYEAPRLEVGDPIGDMTLQFHSPGQATMSYTIDGTRGTKSIVRQPFGVPEAPRHAGVTDMWWGGAAENGWGVAVMQQNATLFMIWFTYDARNQPAWWVMPGGKWIDANTYEGRIHRPFGSAWLDRMFDSGRIQAPDLGPFRLRFEGDDRLTLEYSILGRSGQLNLTRQPF